MRWLPFVVCAACSGHTSTQTPDAGPATLTVELHGVDTEVTGNGIACGTDPACGSGAAQLTTCTVTLAAGTPVSLTVHHPVCSGGTYFNFGLSSPPCAEGLGRMCTFTIEQSETVIVTGAEAIR